MKATMESKILQLTAISSTFTHYTHPARAVSRPEWPATSSNRSPASPLNAGRQFGSTSCKCKCRFSLLTLIRRLPPFLVR